MSRFWPNGVTVTVEVSDDAAPRAFVWEQHRHTVAVVILRWRRHVYWWSNEVWRECFLVRTERGLLLEIFHELKAERWAVQRVYD